MARKNNQYFDDFITMASYSVQAAEYLHEVINHFDPSALNEQCKIIHKIEHEEDGVKHVLIKRLAKEFVPPIDREDIIELAHELDSVTDKVEEILIRMFMYNIFELRDEALVFADLIVRCCKTLKKAVEEFANFQRSTTLKQTIIEVNTLEEEGDKIYIGAVRRLYSSDESSRNIIVWTELFERMEDCCDACEHVADRLEIVAMKNS